MKSKQSAETLSQKAREASKLCNLWLEHPYVAHQLHEAAAAAHDNEAVGSRAEFHKRLASEHRAAAQFWAGKELQTLNRCPGSN